MTDRGNKPDAGSTQRTPTDWEAFARHLAGETSPDEAARIQASLSDRPADRELLEALDRAMSHLAATPPEGLDVEAALQRVRSRMSSVEARPLKVQTEKRKYVPKLKWRVPAPAIAAAAILAVGLGTWRALQTRSTADTLIETPRMLATGVGVRDSMALPDGSQVVLGPLSKIILARDYGSTTREVEIQGEAWFDVKHDESKPFSVRAGTATILDVGTKFAVRSDSVTGVAVTVTEGSVSLRTVNTPVEQGVILQAGDNGLLKPGGQVVARRGTAKDDDVAWLKGRLVFREAPISEVVASLHRWYGLHLQVTDQSLMDKHITASFAGESPEKVLEVLRLALGAEIERRRDTVFVRPAQRRVRSR